MEGYGDFVGYLMLRAKLAPEMRAWVEALDSAWEYIDPNSQYIKGIIQKGGHHLTVQANADVSRVGTEKAWKELVSKNTLHLPPALEVSVVKFRFFENKDYDCLVMEIKPTPELEAYRSHVCEILPHWDRFGKWTPHVTIGYFQKKVRKELEYLVDRISANIPNIVLELEPWTSISKR